MNIGACSLRAKVPPFTRARDVLTGLSMEVEVGVSSERDLTACVGREQGGDLLHLCHCVPLEVMDIKIGDAP